MDKIQKEKFIKYLDRLEEEDKDYKCWADLDHYEKTLYRAADVIQFFIVNMITRDGDVQLAKEFRKAWHHILGSIDMHENDELHYRTSKI